MRRTMVIFLVAAILMAVVVCVPIVALPIAVSAPRVAALDRPVDAAADVQPLALRSVASFRAPPV